MNRDSACIISPNFYEAIPHSCLYKFSLLHAPISIHPQAYRPNVGPSKISERFITTFQFFKLKNHPAKSGDVVEKRYTRITADFRQI